MFKQLFSLAALSALLVVVAADSTEKVEPKYFAETVEGYKFFTAGPRLSASKADYEVTTHKTVMELLKARLGEDAVMSLLQPDVNGADAIWHEVIANSSSGSWGLEDAQVVLGSQPNVTASDELAAYKTAVALLKTRLGEDELASLLQPDIKAADTIWHEVIANSTGVWVSADGRAVAFLPNVTALRFLMWQASPWCDAANSASNAEHYIKRTVETSPGVLQSEILEGWGGVVTLFSIPSYGTPNRTTHPFLNELPNFPYQGAGDKVLRDGTNAVFGVLHISVRDVDGVEFGETSNGIEIYASVWYGDGAADDFLEAERQHMVIEIINVAIQAQKDIESGKFAPPV
ncbi:hypothetical protein B0H17DRAFT_1194790 [Mycena rosella]|uniref:Uncharacterized protein n=1 Tax=Mycena rosella TaxID=1033263 RepID=A0AAD7DXS8_MYCRO|nr:hypothetical protein B0H17DRAFT_1194790 [Mycena rosella]